MTEYNKIIEFLKKIKIDLTSKSYDNENKLEEDFNKSLSMVWEDLNDLATEDLSDLYKVQEFLINEVCTIDRKEKSEKNRSLIEENLNINNISDKLEDGKKALNIYSLNDINWKNYLIGDIHSDTISLIRILEKVDFFTSIVKEEKIRLIFLGDYVDRGKAQLKIIQYICTLKYLFPENIILLRGNHDGGSFINGEIKMWVRRPEKDRENDWFLLYLYNLARSNKTFPIDAIDNCLRFFDSLGNIAFLSYKELNIMISHGGIPRPKKEGKAFYSYINSISDLTNEGITDNLNKTIVNNMMWSDPALDNEDLRGDKGRFRFTQEQFKDFSNMIGFDILVRGHQVQEKGYKTFFNNRLINIFSSGRILKNGEDINIETAYTRVNPHIIKLNPEGEIKFINLNG